MRNRLFIGSSSESLDLAYTVQDELGPALEVTVWTQGLFVPSKTAMESLAAAPAKYNAALFIFTPDDQISIRGESKRVTRDNVIFELGLFVGALGRDNCFILLPHGVLDLHLPTDLAGVVHFEYDPDRQDGNLNAAVGPACNRIRRALVPGYGKTASPGPLNQRRLEELIVARAHRLVFNPPDRSKRIVFGPNGIVLEGNNRNENSWRIVDGRLELLQLDGQIYSRFRYDRDRDRWTHTNDPDTLSRRDQYIVYDE